MLAMIIVSGTSNITGWIDRLKHNGYWQLRSKHIQRGLYNDRIVLYRNGIWARLHILLLLFNNCHPASIFNYEKVLRIEWNSIGNWMGKWGKPLEILFLGILGKFLKTSLFNEICHYTWHCKCHYSCYFIMTNWITSAMTTGIT